jgi:hypothetical protein
MVYRDVQAKYTALRSRHSDRSDHSAELNELSSQIQEQLDHPKTKERDRARWLWLSLDIAALLENRRKQLELVDELAKCKFANQPKVAKIRMGLLVQSGQDSANARRLSPKEFREKAKTLVGSAEMDAGWGLRRSLIYKADLPHFLPHFHRSEKPNEELALLWDETIALTGAENSSMERLLAVTRKMLEIRGDSASTLIYAFLGSLHLHIHQAGASALAYPEPVTAKVDGVPTPLEIIELMMKEFSHKQLAESLNYLLHQYLKEIFFYPYVLDEKTKKIFVEHYHESLSEKWKFKLTMPDIRQYLRLSTLRFQFWEDATERQVVLAKARGLVKRAGASEDSTVPDWQEIQATICFLEQRQDAASAHLLKAASLKIAAGDFSKSAVNTFVPYESLKEEYDHHGAYACEAVKADLSALDGLAANPYPGVVITTADSKYFLQYGKRYAESLREHEPDAPLLFHVIDLNDAARELYQSLSAKYKDVFLSSETAIYPRPFYYATVRLLRAFDFVSHAKRPVLFTDIDMKFNSGTRHVFEYAKDFDLMFRIFNRLRIVLKSKKIVLERYPVATPWDRVNASAMLFNATPVGLEMADAVSRMSGAFITRFGPQKNATNWWIDQNILYQFERWFAADGRARVGNLEDIRNPLIGYQPFALSDAAKMAHWRREVIQP